MATRLVGFVPVAEQAEQVQCEVVFSGSSRAMEEVTNAIIDRNAAKAEAARQIMQRCALLARLSEVEAASSGTTSKPLVSSKDNLLH